MRLTLHYRGPLKSNGRRDEKHQLRRHFHDQLLVAWKQQPLVYFGHLLAPPANEGGLSVLQEPRRGFTFAPLICTELHLVAELEIFLLWRQPPGNIITAGGDIDNRLKTLLDALKMPETNALPDGASPADGETPFFCLLEDDSLVTRVSVETDQLLEPAGGLSEVDLTIRVLTRQLRVLIGTVGLH